MSKTVDERVVEMRFDNKQFETNVKTSIDTLNRLKDNLNLTGAAKGMENVDAVSKKMNFSVLSNAIDGIGNKFSALEVMAVTALANITNSAVNAAKKMLSSLTIEPITEGFGEYELKMDSVQTIMNGTGESLQTVNKYLDELNTYADRTIYSFSDMTSSIGKFTNNGVKLDDAVKAIQGISNEAALSGANAEQASHAMYNFAQALSSGSVKLIDWKSIENANMATVQFKNELIKTAVAVGTLVEEEGKYVSTTTNGKGEVSEAFDATNKFNDSLSHQWMTTDVLVKTLAKYTDETTELGKKAFAAAQDVKTFSQLMDTLKEAVGSGWATTWETVFGDFNEAKTLWTGVSNVIGSFIDNQSKARNELLKTWKDLGGRNDLIQALKNTFEGLRSIIIPVKDAFREIFPPITAKKLVELSKNLKELTSKFKISDETAKKLKDTFRGLFSVVGLVKNFLGAILRSISPLLSSVGGFSGKILGLTGSFGKWLSGVHDLIKKNDTFYKSIQLVIEYIKRAIRWIKNFADAVRKNLHLPEISEVKEQFSSMLQSLKEKLGSFGEKSLGGIRTFCNEISKAFGREIKTDGLDNVNKKLKETEKNSGKVKKVFDGVKTTITNAIKTLGEKISGSKFFQFLKAVWGLVQKIGVGIGRLLGNALTSLTDKLNHMDFDTFLNFIKTISVGGIALTIKKFLDGVSGGLDNLSGGLSGFKKITKGITNVLNGVEGCLESYQTKLKAGALLKIAIAIGILAASLLVISLIDKEKMSSAIMAITMLFAELMGSMALFSKTSDKTDGVSKSSKALLIMSASVLILAVACKKLASIDPEALAAGVSGLTVLMFMLAEFAKKLSDSKKIMSSSVALIAIALAMRILVSACKKLSSLSWEELGKGAGGLTVLMYVLVEFTKKLSGSKKLISAGLALIAVAGAMKLLVSACKSLSSLSWEELGKGAGGLTVLMYVLVEFTKKLSGSQKLISAGLALIAVAGAMKLLVSACKSLSSLSWEELGKGVGGLTVLLYVLVEFTKKLSGSKKLISAGLALIEIAGALKILVSACKSLSELSIEDLIKGLTGVGVLLLEVTAYTKLSGKTDHLIKSSAALIVLGEGLKILASACKGLAEMDWESIGKALTGIGALLLEVALFTKMTGNSKNMVASGVSLVAMGAGLKIFASACKAFASLSWEEIAKALIAIAGAFTVIGIAGKVLAPIVPSILGLSASLTLLGVGLVAIGAGLLLIGGGLTSFSIGLTSLTTSLSVGATEIAVALGIIIGGIADLIPYIVKKLGEALIELCKVISDGAPEIGKAIKEIVVLVIGILSDCIPQLVDAFFKLIITLLDALIEYTPDIVSKIMEFLTLLLEEVAKKLPDLVKAAVDVLMSFFTGIFDAFNNMDSGVLSKALSGVGIFAQILVALAGLGVLAVPAMAGVLAVGVLVTEMAGVFAALGMLEQIPGLDWLINSGGQLLEAIGSAIGGFVGGIVGSAMESISGKLPKIGKNLADFFNTAKPFIEGVGKLKASSLSGVKALAEIVVILTATDIIDGLTSWFTGGSSLINFGKELAEFGPSLSSYYNSVKNVKDDVVTSSANAAMALAKLAQELPPHDGLAQKIFGQTTLSDFAKELESFGPSIAKYSNDVSNVNPEVVSSSANAAMALAKLAQELPPHDGLLQWISGDATLTSFADELKSFGPAIAEYSQAIGNVNPEAVTASANAALALAGLANDLPPHDGLIQWFTGDATLSSFANELKDFGPAIAEYSKAVGDINPDAVIASANAASILSKAEENLPKHDGLLQKFTGDSSLSLFAAELKELGPSMAQFSKDVEGIDKPSVDAAANAALMLTRANTNIPPAGGLKQLVDGKKSLKLFAAELVALGPSLKSFSDDVQGIDEPSVAAAANATLMLAEANGNIPETGGLKEIWNGTIDLKKFAEELVKLGPAIRDFSDFAVDVDKDAVTASANAINVLAEANEAIPESGGVKQFWTGESSLTKFAAELIPLANSLFLYGERIKNIENTELVEKSAGFASTLAEVAGALPNVGGIGSWFSGNKQSLSDFGSAVAGLGDGIALFYSHLYGTDTEKFDAITETSIKLVDMGEKLQDIDVDVYKKFGESLSKMATDGISDFSKAFKNSESDIKQVALDFAETFKEGLDSTTQTIGSINLAMAAIISFMYDELDKSKDKWKEKGQSLVTSLSTGISSKVKESDQSVKKMLDSMTDVIKSKEKSFRSSGDAIVSNLQYGIQQRKSDVEKLSENIVTVWMAVPVKNKYNDFYDVGVYMVTGFSKGISDNLSLAENAAKDMANAAKTSAQKALDEHSPSKVGYQIGDYFGEGFVNALNDYQSISYMAGGKIAGSAKDGLNDAIKGVAESIDDNPELTPTIRPVIDLSDVQRGADTVSSLFGTEHSLGLAYQSESLFNSGVSIARDIKVNNDNVVSEIRNLRNDVNALNTAISEMRVVMDTGALVGSIALPVNRALGRQSKWEQRGH